jgi:hypothetical protein
MTQGRSVAFWSSRTVACVPLSKPSIPESGFDGRKATGQCGRWTISVSKVKPVAGSTDTALPESPP